MLYMILVKCIVIRNTVCKLNVNWRISCFHQFQIYKQSSDSAISVSSCQVKDKKILSFLSSSPGRLYSRTPAFSSSAAALSPRRIHHVCRHPGHKPCRRKLVYIGEGKCLYPFIHGLSQIHAKTRTGSGCSPSGFHTKK